ncbi:hypothetical protein MSMEI_3812 [Mycolicibacterium smegmatis MC2 155]|uniref:Uncharacterized protein n=1 Tax=Mycolicibacterium smegmatis (strain ATCC 700084 / mc(2)155) TaxID=246196 RepID=I7FFR3_MYCS2|nr:hypothetical protein MSMEI_3812 [Mycolicibacterium smegmatis MC2 155]
MSGGEDGITGAPGYLGLSGEAGKAMAGRAVAGSRPPGAESGRAQRGSWTAHGTSARCARYQPGPSAMALRHVSAGAIAMVDADGLAVAKLARRAVHRELGPPCLE